MALHKLIFDPTDSDTRGDTHTVGAVLYDKANDRLGVINASNELLVKDDDIETAIENISHAEDAAHVSGDLGNMALAVRNDSEGSLVDTDGDYAPLQVDSVGRLRVIADLDYTDPANHDEDAAHVSGDTGNFALSIRMDDVDGSNSALLAGTEGDYQGFFTNDKGELHVRDNDSVDLLTTIDADTSAIAVDTAAMVVDLAAIEAELLDQGVSLDTIAGDTTSMDAILTALSKAEDSVHGSGDQGIMGLAVRNDTLASLVDADGDYAPLQVNADGALYVVDQGAGSDDALANTAIKQVAETVGTSAAVIVDGADELASRKYFFAYNNDNRDVFIGDSGVSAANGFPIPPGAILEARIGDAVDIYMIGDKAGTDVRTLQLS